MNSYWPSLTTIPYKKGFTLNKKNLRQGSKLFCSNVEPNIPTEKEKKKKKINEISIVAFPECESINLKIFPAEAMLTQCRYDTVSYQYNTMHFFSLSHSHQTKLIMQFLLVHFDRCYVMPIKFDIAIWCTL